MIQKKKKKVVGELLTTAALNVVHQILIAYATEVYYNIHQGSHPPTCLDHFLKIWRNICFRQCSFSADTIIYNDVVDLTKARN